MLFGHDLKQNIFKINLFLFFFGGRGQKKMCVFRDRGGPRTRIRADARGPKLKIRGHSAARMPADVYRL